MRDIRNINAGWQFIKEDIGAEAAFGTPGAVAWEAVDLPHTWNAYDGANGFDYFKGACWYRKDIQLKQDDAGKQVFLEFEGANSVADVYVNGRHLGQHRGGFSTFRFDATGALKPGHNTLAVKVDNTVFEDVYPQMADFTFYGGLYRSVNLVVVEKLHFELMDFGSQGIYIAQEEVSEAKASLSAKVLLANEKEEAAAVRVWIDFTDADGTVKAYAAKDAVIEPGTRETVVLPIEVKEPVLWQGRKNPYLYTAKVSLQHFNDTVDYQEIPIGLRYFSVDPEEGFFLNGKHTPLNGVSRHQDRKDMGWAITRKEHEEDMELIKEVGATSIRLAHYQHDQYFYDLCDREGMAVWAEIPFISIMSKTELEGINPKQQMVELVRQNFNHPSIFFWGVQNEIQIGGDRPEVRRLVRELHELTKQEDPTRLTTMANVMFVPDEDEYNYMTDIVGYNKYYGWYQGKSEDFAPWLDGFHKTNPKVALCISEYGAEGILRYHSETPEVKDYTEEYHALYHETVWNIFKERKYLWATYVWNMFDFGANIRDEGGVKGRNNKGLVTYDRKIKKDGFYLYKANWSAEPFVQIGSKRFLQRAQDTIDVKIYTTCEHAELTVNGQAAGSLQGIDAVGVFRGVKLAEGVNEVLVVAEMADGTVCRDKACFELVAEENPAYKAPEAKGSVVANWFDMPEDMEDIEVEELVIPEGALSTAMSIGKLMQDPEGRKVLSKYLGDIESQPMYGMMEGMSIDTLAGLDSEVFSEKLIYRLNKELVAASGKQQG